MFKFLRSIIPGKYGLPANGSSPAGSLLDVGDYTAMIHGTPAGQSLLMQLLDNQMDLGATRYVPLNAGVEWFSDQIAMIPFSVFEKSANGRRKAEEHPAYRLLRRRPNDAQPPSVWLKHWVKTTKVSGNGIQLIERNDFGEVVNLRPLDNQYVTIFYIDGKKKFKYKSPRLERTYEDSDILHLINNSPDGIAGRPLMSLAAQVVKLGRAVESAAIRSFTHGFFASSYIKIPPTATPEQVQQIVTEFEKAYQGSENAWSTPVMPYGAEIVPLPENNREAQLLELRRYQLEESARLVPCPVHALESSIQGGGAITYANIEAQTLSEYRRYLQPMVTQIEEQLTLKLCGIDSGYYVEAIPEERLEGDTAARYAAYAIAIDKKFMSPELAAEKENLPKPDKELAPEVKNESSNTESSQPDSGNAATAATEGNANNE